jgi:hypothetical protein
MTSAREVLERNQALLDKATKENGRLLLLSGTMKKQLAEAQETLANCRSETLKAMEPKLQELLDDHKSKMQRRAIEYERQIQEIGDPLQSELDLLRADADAQIARIESDCKSELHRMKTAALEEEQRMKEILAEHLSAAPDQLTASNQELQARLRDERFQWQAHRGIELRQEFEAKFEADQHRSAQKQDRLLREVTEKLRAEAQVENRHLLVEEARTTSKNREIENDIQKSIRITEKELEKLRHALATKRGEKDQLADRRRKCDCRRYRAQIEDLQHAIAQLADQLETEKQLVAERERSQQAQVSDARAALQGLEDENASLANQLKDLKAEADRQEEITKARLRDVEERHQNEIQLIGIRVRQTVEKKDAIIQQLMDRLDELGGTVNDF